MFKQHKAFVTFSILVLLAVFLLYFLSDYLFFSQLPATQPAVQDNPQPELSYEEQALGVLKLTDPLRGSPEAALAVIEFGDFQCPFCADAQEPLARIFEKYQDRIIHVWKDFPIPGHFEARPAAEAARCAQDQGKFWEYHDFLFANQDLLGGDLYPELAQRLELDLGVFNSCLASGSKASMVGQGLTDGQLLDVTGTPFFIIGGSVIDGAPSYEQLELTILQELQRLEQ